MRREWRDDDLTLEEHTQLAALKPLREGPLGRMILGLARLRPPEPEPVIDEDTAAALRGHAIVVALQAQRNPPTA